VTMLAASLRLVAGRRVTTVGTSHDVIDLAVAGIGARTALEVHVDGRPAFPVRAPEVAALALVQLAVNAARHRRDRQRWGLGFCRIAADTLGGAIYPPADRGDGTVGATLELGLQDLTLPLAAIRGHRVVKATRTWDEETGCLPGAGVEPGSRLAGCPGAPSGGPGGGGGWE